jgi:hypothetical protein
VQRQLSLQVPFGACDLPSAEASRDAHLDPLGPEALCRLDGLAHGAAESDALLQLRGDRLGDELGIDLGLVDLEDVDEHVPLRPLLDLFLEPVDLHALATDDDSGPGGQDIDFELVRGTLDVDRGHPRVAEPVLQHLAQAEVLVQQLGVFLFRVPTGPPGLVEPQAEPERMDFLPHVTSSALPLLGRSPARNVQIDGHVTGSFVHRKHPAHRLVARSLERRRVVDDGTRHHQPVHVDVGIAALGRVTQDRQRILHALAPDLVHDQSGLLGRYAQILELGFGDHLCFLRLTSSSTSPSPSDP